MSLDEDPQAQNSFDQIGPDLDQKKDNEFDKIGPDVPVPSSTVGTFGRAAARGALPAVGSWPAVAAGAEIGGAAGAPLGPGGALAGGIIGGTAGGLLASTAIATAQEYGMHQLPESWLQKIGMDERQQRIDQEAHPTAYFIGGIAPYALTMRPGVSTVKNLPENAGALMRLMSHPLTARIFGGTLMGGMTLAQEAIYENKVSWTDAAIATAFGLVFNRPTRFGERLTAIGEAPFRAMRGETAAPATPAPEQRPETQAAPETAVPEQPAAEATAAAQLAPKATSEPANPAPTIAQAGDLKVMGPGITESVFMGSQQQADAARMTAQDTARTERIVMGEPAPAADVHAMARRMEPETFERYDELADRKAHYEAILAEDHANEAARKHLLATDYEMRGLGGDVAAAYRRAAERTETPFAEPPAAEAPIPDLEGQKTRIADDVTQQLMSAGRPKEEAEAAGKLIAERYAARSARMGGALGTPEELYRSEGAVIRGGRGVEPVREAEMAQAEEPKLSVGRAKYIERRLSRKAPEDLTEKQRGDLAEARRVLGIAAPGKELHQRITPLSGHKEEGVAFGHKAPDWADADNTITDQWLETPHGEYKYDVAHLASDEGDNAISTVWNVRKVDPETREEIPIGVSGLPDDARVAIAKEQRKRLDDLLDPTKEFYQTIHQANDEDDLKNGFVAYHGTPYDFEKFSTDYASHQAEPGIFFSSSPTQASAFANEAGGRVIPVNIKPANPKIVDFSEDGHSVPYKGKAMQDAIKAAKDAGHDVLVVKGMREVQSRGATEGDQVIVLKPGVVKSAISPAKELYQRGPFYSAVGQAVDDSRLTKGSPDQWLGTLKNAPGVKQEELDWLGLPEWLKEQKGSVTKEQVADYIRANQIEVRDVVKRGPNRPDDPDYIDFGRISEDQGDARFSQYQLPGGTNYRELLLTLPPKEDAAATHLDPFYDLVTGEVAGHMPGNNPNVFRSGHFDEPNVLAHVRFNDRVDANGKKTLFLEEVQSDWHQKGRKAGYGPQTRYAIRIKDGDLVGDFASREEAEKNARASFRSDGDWSVEEHKVSGSGVPDAPFKTTWPELALKRMIRWAAEHGYDQIAWTPGDVQAARYDLSRQVDAIHYTKTPKGYELYGSGGPGATSRAMSPIANDIPEEKLADYVGKELAEKIANGQGAVELGTDGMKTLRGADLKVGGEGMKGFYDKILPAAANKLGKKFGAKAGTTKISAAGGKPTQHADFDAWQKAKTEPQEVWSLPITDKMKEAALSQGFPLFQGARGKINLNPTRERGADYIGVSGVRPLLTLMKEANASTFIHETGHQFLAEIMRDAQHPSAPGQLRDDADTVLGWLGAHSAEDIKTRHHEKFARGFEQYLREGVAPSPELAGVFARFKQWLLQIYQTLKGLGQPINEDIRQVFDRMLAAEPQRTVIADERPMGPTLADIHAVDAEMTESHESAPAADRVSAETERKLTEAPMEVRNELETRAGEVEQPGAGTEQPGQVGAGPGQGGQVEPGTGAAGPQPEGGVAGERIAPVVPGGTQAAPEGNAMGAAAERAPLAPRPADIFGPRESRLVDKAGNIRIDNLTTRDDVAEAIRDAAAANDEFIGDRRGVVTDGQVMDLADALGMDFDRLMKRKVGEAFNAEQIVAARKLLLQSATNVADLAKKAASGTDADVMAYAQAKDRHQLIQGQVAGLTAEWGRAGRAFRSLVGTQEARSMDQFLREATGKTLFQLREEAKLAAQLDSPQKVSRFAADGMKRSFGRMVLEYWYGALLSGYVTHVTNAVSNTILSLQHFAVEQPAAAAIGALRASMGREGERIRIGELVGAAKGAKASLPAAARAAGESFKAGTSALLPGETPHGLAHHLPEADLVSNPVVHEATKAADLMNAGFALARGLREGIVATAALIKAGGVEGSPLFGTKYSLTGQIPDIQIRGVTALPLGTVARLPGRFLSAADSFFRAINYSAAKNSIAYRRALEEGLTNEAFDRRVAELINNPSPEMMESSRQTATELTLMTRTSPFLQRLQMLTNTDIMGMPFAKFVMPFVNVVGNILDQSIVQRTPIGLLSPELRADLMGRNGNIAQDTAMARMLVGSALALAFGSLAAEGYVTGSGPSDPHEAAMWKRNYQPHSVRIGDTWYDMQKLGNFGMIVGMAADLYDASQRAAADELSEAASVLVHSIAQNILDTSMMQGPAEFLRAVDDSDRYGPQYVRNFLSSFVPVGVGQVARSQDPYVRQARTIIDALKANIPGMSQDLFPKRDIYGEPIMRRERLGPTGIYMTPMKNDPVDKEMIALGIHPAPVGRTIRNVQLTDQEYDDYARISGRMLKMRLDMMVKSPQWQTLPPSARHDLIESQISACRETGRAMIMMRYPHIPVDAVEAIRTKLRQ